MSRYSGDNGLGSMILQGLALGEATRRNREQEELERRALAERELYNQRAFQFDYDQLGQRKAELGQRREEYEYRQAQDQMAEEAAIADAQRRRQSFLQYAGSMGMDPLMSEQLADFDITTQRQEIERFQKQQAEAKKAQQEEQKWVRAMEQLERVVGPAARADAELERETNGVYQMGGRSYYLPGSKPPMTADSVTGLQRRDPAAIAAYLNSGGNPNDIGDFGTAPSAPLDASVYARARAGDPGAIMALRNAGAISPEQAGRSLMGNPAMEQARATEIGRLQAKSDRIRNQVGVLTAKRAAVEDNPKPSKDAKEKQGMAIDQQIERLLEESYTVTEAMSTIEAGGVTEEQAIRMAASELGPDAPEDAILRRAEELMQGIR